MIYAIIAIVFVAALMIVLWGDHDKSYSKKERGYNRSPKSDYQTKAKEKKSSAGASSSTSQNTSSNAGASHSSQANNTSSSTSGSKKTVFDEIIGDLDEVLRETAKAAEDPMARIGKAMDAAKDVFGTAAQDAFKKAKEAWKESSKPSDDVDEQFPED